MIETSCQTSGAIFHTTIGRRQVACIVDLPADLDLTALQAETLEGSIHNAVELALAPWFIETGGAELVRQYETRTGPQAGDPFDADVWMSEAAAALAGKRI
jgi:hypothetical protein